MEALDEFAAMAQACIDNHDDIMLYGSPEMQIASRMLLYALAAEVQRRAADAREVANDD